MELKDVEIGMRVVPHSKSTGMSSFDDDPSLRKAKEIEQQFLFVRYIWDDGEISLCPVIGDDTYVSLYIASDFEPYVEPSK